MVNGIAVQRLPEALIPDVLTMPVRPLELLTATEKSKKRTIKPIISSAETLHSETRVGPPMFYPAELPRSL